VRQPIRSRRQTRQHIADSASIPAPVGGWDAVSSLEDMPPDRAPVLDNWFPTTSDVRVRRGYKTHCIGLGSDVVESLMVYHGLTTATSKMFAAANLNIYDVSAAGTTTSQSISTSNNRFQSVNFSTSGGKFLFICNGQDNPQIYNGSVWAAASITSASTVTIVTATDIIHVNAHKNRLWFVLKDSTKAAYLPTSSIAGAATAFEMGGQFTKGGYLVATATWTKDGGSGEDDLWVGISSRGQVAVYQGTDPASANTWALVGVYDVGSPIGRRCFTKVAGDIALVNIDGVLPLSRALTQDRGAVSAIALTKNINNAMNEAAREYAENFGWELTPYPKGTMALLNVPIEEGETQHQYVVNTLTGAWSRFTGLNANCFAVFNDNLYFGGNSGTVYQADVTGVDLNTIIEARGQTAYNYYNSRGKLKKWKMLQPLLTTDSDSRPGVGLSTDFQDNASIGTPSVATTSSALYDSAVYDTDIYAIENRSVTDWTTVEGHGQCASVHFSAHTGPEQNLGFWGVGLWGSVVWSDTPSGDIVMRLHGFNVLYERGGIL
jgi:hypothetical protein